VEGETLREKLRKLEGIRLNWFVSIARHLHKTGKFHGDLKPENIIITPKKSVKLIDPGVIMPPISNNEGYQSLQITTPHYNPLLLRKEKADVMAMGIMLYEILTGELPYEEVPFPYAGHELVGGVEQLQFELSFFLSHTPVSTLKPNAPKGLEIIVKRCLLRQKDYGYEAFGEDLVDFIKTSNS